MLSSGEGVLMIIDFDPNLIQPMTVVQTHKWPDGLFDVCWSEKVSGVCCTASGDGSILLWNDAKPVSCLLFLFFCQLLIL